MSGKRKATTWAKPTATGTAPRPRCSHASCFTDHKLVICGGWAGGNRFLNDVHIYNVDTNQWSQPKTEGQLKTRVGHSLTPGINPKEVWVIGGSLGSSALLDVQVLNLDTNIWTEPLIQGDQPEPRSRHSANKLGSNIYVFGGGDGIALYNDLWSLNLENLSWSLITTSGNPPSKRWGHTATLVDTRLFIFGGHDGTNRLNDVHVLELKTMIWTSPECKPKQLSSRNHQSNSPVSNLSISTSSISSNTNNDDASENSTPRNNDDLRSSSSSINSLLADDASQDLNDEATNSENNMSNQGRLHNNRAEDNSSNSIPPARAGHTASCLGRKLIIYGGGDGKLLGDVYYLNVDTFEWSNMESGNVPDRCAHTADVYASPQGSRLLVFGGSNGIKTFNDLYVVSFGKKSKVRTGSNKKKNLSTSLETPVLSIDSNLPPLSSSSSQNGSSSPRTVNGNVSPRMSYKDALKQHGDHHSSTSQSNEVSSSSSSGAPPSPNILIRKHKSPKSLESSSSSTSSGSSLSPSNTRTASPQSSDKLHLILREIGLEKIWKNLVEQEITIDQIPHLTDQHLKSLGITSVRDQALASKLKERITKMENENQTEAQELSTISLRTGRSLNQTQQTVNGITSKSLELARQVQLSTDALATASDSLRAASKQHQSATQNI